MRIFPGWSRFRSQRWILVPSNGGFLQWLCSISCDSPGRRQKIVSWHVLALVVESSSMFLDVWFELKLNWKETLPSSFSLGKDGSPWIWIMTLQKYRKPVGGFRSVLDRLQDGSLFAGSEADRWFKRWVGPTELWDWVVSMTWMGIVPIYWRLFGKHSQT